MGIVKNAGGGNVAYNNIPQRLKTLDIVAPFRLLAPCYVSSSNKTENSIG
jgi:hypothetical protein